MMIKLNDFESFDKMIFSDAELLLPEDERWKLKMPYDSYGNKINIPFQKPDKNSDIIYYQLMHYILWMTMWAHKLLTKPAIMHEGSMSYIEARYYACRFVYLTMGDIKVCCCPISIFQNKNRACVDTVNAFSTRPELENEDDVTKSSYEIAHLKWRDM